MSPLLLFAICLLGLVLEGHITSTAVASSVKGGHKRTQTCVYYDRSKCASLTDPECTTDKTCDDGKNTHCFAVMEMSEESQQPIVVLKDCFINGECTDNQCVKAKKQLYYCCCQGNLCNANITLPPITPEQTDIMKISTANQPPPIQMKKDDSMSVVVYVMIGIMAMLVVVACSYYVIDRRKFLMFNELPTMDPNPMPPPSPLMRQRPIQLLEIKERGRFGAVWKAQLKSEAVAVKIFPIQDKQSWLAEQEVYQLPNMEHSNVLHFIGVEKRGDNLHAEFWLVTAYHELGSLYDYLKAHTLTWPQVCRVAESMARGLTHIHDEIPASKAEGYKPALAHRDFKSKNVLLKSDLSACIADFGLALVFEPGKPCGDTHGQVGTRRYMAPEVLEGAINFTRDAFLRIDMYACGLVLWELASRCSFADALHSTAEYRLPFEDEVGQHPTLEDMQESVVQRKVRPALRDDWRTHAGMSALCDTIEECWDHDAEARLSASCVMERLALQSRFQHTNQPSMRIENEALHSPQKECSM